MSITSVYTTNYYSIPRTSRGIPSSKAAFSANPRWAKLTLYGINGDTGMRGFERTKQKKYHKCTVMILIYKQTE
jgi:hypothetical protein